jgi:hypothetical protein
MARVLQFLFGTCTCSCGMFSKYGCMNNKHCHNKATGCNV